MEKYLSFRIEKIANEKVLSQINHDMRIGKQPKYIQRDKSHKNITLTGAKFNKLKHEEHLKKQNGKSKRKIQKNTERFFTGVMTFSEEMRRDYKNNDGLFAECSKDFLEKLKERYKMENIYSEIHLDETTPHIHILFDNIDDSGKSVRRNINPKILSEIQTLMGECFEDLEYKRGKPKDETLAKHFNFRDYEKIKAEYKKMSKEVKNLDGLFQKFNSGTLDDAETVKFKEALPNVFRLLGDLSQKQRATISENITKGLNKKI